MRGKPRTSASARHPSTLKPTVLYHLQSDLGLHDISRHGTWLAALGACTSHKQRLAASAAAHSTAAAHHCKARTRSRSGRLAHVRIGVKPAAAALQSTRAHRCMAALLKAQAMSSNDMRPCWRLGTTPVPRCCRCVSRRRRWNAIRFSWPSNRLAMTRMELVGGASQKLCKACRHTSVRTFRQLQVCGCAPAALLVISMLQRFTSVRGAGLWDEVPSVRARPPRSVRRTHAHPMSCSCCHHKASAPQTTARSDERAAHPLHLSKQGAVGLRRRVPS